VPVTTTEAGFPSAPRSLDDIGRFLADFWAWVSCRFFGRC
jgi:hypothetical protein